MNPTQSLRAELLSALSQLSQLRPEWRFGQTLANLAMTAGRADAGGVWELEDEEALAAARTLIEEYSAVDATGTERLPSANGGGETVGSQSLIPSSPRRC